jgi:hypothetical protein
VAIPSSPAVVSSGEIGAVSEAPAGIDVAGLEWIIGRIDGLRNGRPAEQTNQTHRRQQRLRGFLPTRSLSEATTRTGRRQ